MRALREFGAAPYVRRYLGRLPSHISLALAPSSCGDYVALHGGPGAQIALYTHKESIDVAMRPEHAARLSFQIYANVYGDGPTHYLHLSRSHLEDHFLFDVYDRAVALSLDWTLMRHGGGRRPTVGVEHEEASVPTCPVHHLQLPATGVCDDCS